MCTCLRDVCGGVWITLVDVGKSTQSTVSSTWVWVLSFKRLGKLSQAASMCVCSFLSFLDCHVTAVLTFLL